MCSDGGVACEAKDASQGDHERMCPVLAAVEAIRDTRVQQRLAEHQEVW